MAPKSSLSGAQRGRKVAKGDGMNKSYAFKQIAAVLLAVFLTHMVRAETVGDSSASESPPPPQVFASKGFSLGLSTFELKASGRLSLRQKSHYVYSERSEIRQVDVPRFLALELGYSEIRIDRLGFTGGLSIAKQMNKDADDSDDTLTRGEGNLTYGFSGSANLAIYGLAGLSAQSFDHLGGRINLGLGVQAGVGMIFSKKYVAEIGYYLTRHSFNKEYFEKDYPEYELDESSFIETKITALKLGFLF